MFTSSSSLHCLSFPLKLPFKHSHSQQTFFTWKPLHNSKCFLFYLPLELMSPVSKANENEKCFLKLSFRFAPFSSRSPSHVIPCCKLMFTQLLAGAKHRIIKHGRMNMMIIKCKKRANTANVQKMNNVALKRTSEIFSGINSFFFVVSFQLSEHLSTSAKISPRGFSIGHWTDIDNEVNRMEFFAQFLLSCDTKKKKIEIFVLSALKIPFQIPPNVCKCKHSHCLKRAVFSAHTTSWDWGRNEENKKERNWNNTKVFRFVKEVFLLRRASEEKIARLSSYLSKENHRKQSQGAFALHLVPRAQKTPQQKYFHLRFIFWFFLSWLWKLCKKKLEK